MKPLILSAVIAGLLAPAALAATLIPPPVTRRVPITDTIQGVAVADPYRWLEQADEPEVKNWSTAQNVRSRAYLDSVGGRDRVSARLTQLIKAATPSIGGLQAAGGKLFAVYNDPALQQPQIVVMDGSADPDTRKVVLDPNKLGANGSVSVDWFAPSPDGTKLAVSLSLNGSEDGSLHVYDVASGREIEPVIPRVQYPTAGGSVAWTANSKAFWYTRFPDETAPDADRHFFQEAYFHKLGSDWKSDPLVLATQDGVPRTGEIFLDNRYHGGASLASVQLGDGGEWQHWILRPGQRPLKVGEYADKVVAASLGPDGALYGVSRRDAPNGKVLKLAAPYTGGFAAARLIVPEGKIAITTDENTTALTLTPANLLVRYIDGGPSAVTAFDLNGRKARPLSIPPISDISAMEPMDGGDVLYTVNAYLRPPYVLRWNARTGRSTETKIAMKSPIDYGDVEVVREFATSKDGTKVPLNIIRKKGLKLDGSNPTLLYGYGGYGVNQTPGFLGASRRLWLDAGGVFVVANLRGGAEYGEAWHTQGNLLNKQNVFDDFYAAGRWLIEKGYTRSDKLALQGGSNGGLLMGATLTQHPDLAKAVVSSVGIYDMIRVELDPNGAFNTTEFGTVKDPAQFKALYAYSPYHHVDPKARYPAVLLMTGANDGRVNPLNSRKFAAALQAAGGGPVFLRTSDTSGHGIGSSLDERIFEYTDQLVFLFDQLGVKAP